MKNNFLKGIAVTALAVVIFSACQKQETEVTYKAGTAPVLSSTYANNDTIPLVAADSLSPSVTFSWTNPNYQFSDGISSLDVNYYIEIDTLGANFTSPHMQQISVSSALNYTFTVGALNTILGNQLNLVLGSPHTIQVRLVSYLTSQALPVYTLYSSDVLNYIVTPYAPPPLVPLPSSGNLYLVGSATAGGWNNPVPVPSQEFTQVGPTEYKITVYLSGGTPNDATGDDEYLLLPVNGSWSNKYDVADNAVQGLNGVFGYNLAGINGTNGNFWGPTTPGNYVIDVNFQNGTFSVTPQ